MRRGPDAGSGRPKTGAQTRTRFWFDPRFALGLVLVVASIAGVSVVVAGSDRTIAVYAARAPLAVGDSLDPADLVETRVSLGAADTLYLTPARLPADGLVVTRTITAGELIPASAVGTHAGTAVTSIVLDLSGRLSAGLTAGSTVDVWSAAPTEDGGFGPPSVLVGQAAIVRILEPTGLIQSDGARSVEVLVPKAKVAVVLQAVANEEAISLIAVNSPIGG
ncbi:SAF domain-containing protein [Cryobacterium sp. SO2]|uniref:SAF domain-containing protein n=1 Tax=Cryobacterium sp. SO2 TaxID=1897060 RepID=UPI00223E1226|nr:SAF domain-containing protein [Cryobacterium sp. SO2]WEO78185.1 SAF domain-containing protein [Cryobacterium sp. SO2]